MSVEPVYGQDAAVLQLVKAMPPFCDQLEFGPCATIGWADDGVLIGGTVYNNYDPRFGIIELSTAAVSPRWLTRKSLQAMFAFPFDQLQCQMVVLQVGESNTRMRRIAQRFGFNEYIIPRLRGRDEAGCIYTLTVEQWQEKDRRRTDEAESPERS